MNAISLYRFNALLACGVLVSVVLFYAQDLLIPLTFGIFFAMLMTPVSNKLEEWGISRVFSTLISVFIIIITSLVISWLVIMQFKNIAKDLPQAQQKTEKLIQHTQEFVEKKFNIPISKQTEVAKKRLKSFFENQGAFLKSFFFSVTGFLTNSVIVLITMFLLLYQREKYQTFFIKLLKDSPPEEAKKTIENISKVSQHYLFGRFLSVMIFTVLFSIGMLIVGIKNAILLSFVAALLTIVPYVGSIVGSIFPFVVALVTESSTDAAFGALAVIVIVQAFDNYFIEPYIIGGEVQLSALSTILALFVGGIMWGVSGMILFIPMLGMAKIIFDNVQELKLYGYLIGDQKKGRQSTRILDKIKHLFKK